MFLLYLSACTFVTDKALFQRLESFDTGTDNVTGGSSDTGTRPGQGTDTSAEGVGDSDSGTSSAHSGDSIASTRDSDTGPTRTCDDEICNGQDDDCDGEVDEQVTSAWYQDADGDGYGDVSSAMSACDAPTGYVVDATDCDDADASVQPGVDLDAASVCIFRDESSIDCTEQSRLQEQYSTIDIQFDVLNHGCSSPPTFRISVYFSLDTAVDAGDDVACSQDYTASAGLTEGALTTLSIQGCDVPSLSPGMYYVGVSVDSGSAIGEYGSEVNTSFTDEATFEGF